MVNKDKSAWTIEEDLLIRKHYPALAASGMADMLPERAPNSVQVRASKLGVRFMGRGSPNKGYPWPEDELAPVWRAWNVATPGAMLRAAL